MTGKAWTDEEEQRLRKYWGRVKVGALPPLVGRPASGCREKAQQLGLPNLKSGPPTYDPLTDERRTKADVYYRVVWQKCGNCFHREGGKSGTSCSKVQGEIAYHAICNLWKIHPDYRPKQACKPTGPSA